MSEKNNGGPAFPFSMTVEELPHDAEPGKLCVPIKSTLSFPGMTLRDYFAAKALAALINKVGDHIDLQAASAVREGLAITAFEFADEMLEARKA